MKRVLLVNPHETEQSGFTNPPIGLLYIAGTLLKHGFDVRVVDGCLEGKMAISKAIDEFRPELVGITCLTPGRKKALEVARMAKVFDSSAKIIMGGVHPTIMYRQMLEHYPFVDYIVLGEGEYTFLEIALGNDPSTINGLVYRNNGIVIKTSPRKYIEDLDQLPFPAWHLIDLKKYPARGKGLIRGINLEKEPRISVIFSRGCKGHCDFCSTWWIWRGWRHRSAKNMTDEIELLYRDYGIRHFCFADDTMTVNRQATIELCDEIIARRMNIAFHVTTRTDCVDKDMLIKLKAAGCYQIAFGVETGSSLLLKKMGKENDIKTSEKAINLCKKAGIAVTALMIIGNIGETDETVKDTINFLKRTKPDDIGCVGGLWILPGTKLYYECKSKGFIDDDFWLTDEPYKIYTLEYTMKQLAALQKKIINYDTNLAKKIINIIKKVKNKIVKIIHRSSVDLEISAIKKIIRRVYPSNEYDNIFIERLKVFPQALKMSFWKDHFEWKSINDYPEIKGKILDFGCGSGHLDILLARNGRVVHGIDLSYIGISIANYLKEKEREDVRNRLSFTVTDVTRDLPKGELFDSAWSAHVFEHIVYPGPILTGMREWLKPQAYLLISVPLGYAYDDPSHVNHFFNEKDLISYLNGYIKVERINVSEEYNVLRALCKFI
jgi:radical SAM superfamily enzyme YgiQ (UPF0313 family)/SAM-dependent methyltransferase